MLKLMPCWTVHMFGREQKKGVLEAVANHGKVSVPFVISERADFQNCVLKAVKGEPFSFLGSSLTD